MILVAPIWLCKIMKRNKSLAFAVWPFIVVRDTTVLKDSNTVNHEKIHLAQQIELLVIGFFIWYIIEMIALRISDGDNYNSRHISFESEAYLNEKDPNYLSIRKIWEFYNYL